MTSFLYEQLLKSLRVAHPVQESSRCTGPGLEHFLKIGGSDEKAYQVNGND